MQRSNREELPSASGRVPRSVLYRISGPRTIIIIVDIYACAPLIDGLGHGPRNAVHDQPRDLSQASCVIVSGFSTALDLDTNPLSNLIRPRCAERAKASQGKPVLIMHIGLFACFHAISLERSHFSKVPHVIFHSLVALKRLVSLISCSRR